MMPSKTIADSAPRIVHSDDWAALEQVCRPGVLAVIVDGGEPESWEVELADSVRRGAFTVQRCTLNIERPEVLVHEFERCLPSEGLSFETRLALIDDLASLGEALAQIAGCHALMLRLLTEAPSSHCGFHVDTVSTRLPPYGLLKVYNGAGTRYVNPADVRGNPEFYAYLGRRERLAREWRRAQEEDEQAVAAALRASMAALDEALPFLRPDAPVHELRAGSTVAFRHLDVSQHWAEHNQALAWIHCSPMMGEPRLIANFTPLDAGAGRRR